MLTVDRSAELAQAFAEADGHSRNSETGAGDVRGGVRAVSRPAEGSRARIELDGRPLDFSFALDDIEAVEVLDDGLLVHLAGESSLLFTRFFDVLEAARVAEFSCGSRILLDELAFGFDGAAAGAPIEEETAEPEPAARRVEARSLGASLGSEVIGISAPDHGGPDPRNDSIETDEFSRISVSAPGVLDNDAEGEGGRLTVVSFGDGRHDVPAGRPLLLASGARATIHPDGSYSFDPNGAFAYLRPEELAIETLRYTVADAHGVTASATLSIAVRGVSEQADIDDELEFRKGAELAGTVFVDEDDFDAETCAHILVTDQARPVTADLTGESAGTGVITQRIVRVDAPAHGSAGLNPDGTVTYTPEPDFEGEDRFVCLSSEANGEQSTLVVDVLVLPRREHELDDPFASPDTIAADDGEDMAVGREDCLPDARCAGGFGNVDFDPGKVEVAGKLMFGAGDEPFLVDGTVNLVTRGTVPVEINADPAAPKFGELTDYMLAVGPHAHGYRMFGGDGDPDESREPSPTICPDESAGSDLGVNEPIPDFELGVGSDVLSPDDMLKVLETAMAAAGETFAKPEDDGSGKAPGLSRRGSPESGQD